MHRRARHLNPRHAGASLVLDARYISGNDGDAIAIWSDRSGNGNDATQGTSGYKPLLETSIQGGCPVVRFDGSDDRIVVGNPLISQNDSYSWFCLLRPASLGNSPVIWCTESSARQFFELNPASGAYWGEVQFGANYRTYSSTDPPVSTTTFSLLTAVKTGSTTGEYRVQGVMQNAFIGNLVATVVIAENFLIGTDNSLGAFFFNGDIAIFVIIPVSISTALTSRLRHSMALSFKIPCS